MHFHPLRCLLGHMTQVECSSCLQAYNQLKTLPSLIDVDVPEGTKITVCGDVHGQYYDLLNIFDLNGLPSPHNPYLFNGKLALVIELPLNLVEPFWH